jgi:8-oxo-dGTP pyrophosphatase MutT (NUDIX family)
MSGPKRWTPLQTELLQDCAVFQVSRVHTRSPRTGRVHPFFRIDASDWVNVVPLTLGGDVVMVRQYRHGSGEVTLEIPGGMVDPGEDPARAAARELIEETGFRATEIVPIGVLNPNPALFGNRLHVFAAPGAERVAEVRNEGTEETRVELVPRAALHRLVREGRVDHALVVAALHLWELSRDEGQDARA